MMDICRLRNVEKAALEELVQEYENARITLLLFMQRIESEWGSALFPEDMPYKDGFPETKEWQQARERDWLLQEWITHLHETTFTISELE